MTTKGARIVAALALLHTASAACDLAAPSIADAPGGFNWVQTGPVMRLYTTKTYTRQMITSGNSSSVESGTMFTPLCLTKDYMVDKGCVVQCTDTGLDYETYCSGLEINTICKPYNETKMNVGCQLDFDTDEDEYNLGKSLKQIWNETLTVWNTDEGIGSLFTSGVDAYGEMRMAFLPHNYGNLINMGLGVNVARATAGVGNFSYMSMNLATYTTDTPNYQFVEDPLGSTADGAVFFADHWKSKQFIHALNDTDYEAVGGAAIYKPSYYNASEIRLKATYISAIAIDYNPCDADGDAKFMGLPKACFHIHQAGPHMQNGQMWPFYKPLKDGTIDFFGVCPIDKYEPQSNALLAHTYSPENADAFGEASAAAGGLALAHGRTWGLHLCLPQDDPTHPYPCTIGAAPQDFYGNGELSDFMILDPLSFIHNPIQNETEICAAYTAGLCDWSNSAVEVTGEAKYEYPVDSPMPWSPYPAAAPVTSCDLAAPSIDDAPGGFNWVQTGPVMRLYTTKTYPRQMILSGTSSSVEVGTMFTPLCLTKDYMVDKGCVVQCTETGLDFLTYCPGLDINTICKPYYETKMNVGCQLDWDTDEDEYNLGKSLKQIWAETLQVWNTDAGLGSLFTSGFDYYGQMRLPFFPHNYGNLINMGLILNVATSTAGVGNFSYMSMNLGTYTTETEDYQFVEDPLGSTADGPVFFADHWKSVEFIHAANDTNYEAASGAVIWKPSYYNASEIRLKATYLSAIAIEYDPCDMDGNPKFMGLPKACFHIHQAGPHLESGQMWPFYKPLKDGTIDFFGVCSYYDMDNTNEYLSNAVLAHNYSEPNAAVFEAATVAAGGLALPHGRTWGLHLCLPQNDTEHPYPCTIGAAPQEFYGNGELSDFMILDPLGFIHNPIQDETEICAKHTEGLCDWSNSAVEVTGEFKYEYPVDSPMEWSPYAKAYPAVDKDDMVAAVLGPGATCANTIAHNCSIYVTYACPVTCAAYLPQYFPDHHASNYFNDQNNLSMAHFNGSTCADNLPYCYDPPTVLICPETCDGWSAPTPKPTESNGHDTTNAPFAPLNMPDAEDGCRSAVDAAVDTNGMKNAQCVLGNAFANTQWSYSRGEQSPGAPLTNESVYRLASLGDSLVHMTAWKMIEDGYFALDTPLSTQLEFMGGDATVQYYVDNETVGHQSMAEFTVNDAMGMRSGFHLCHYNSGMTGLGAPPFNEAELAFCPKGTGATPGTNAGGQSADSISNTLWRSAAYSHGILPDYYDVADETPYIEAFFDHNVTTASNAPMSGSYYGADLDFLASFMAKTLEAANTTVEAYMDEWLYGPLGIDDWFYWDIGMTCPDVVKDNLVEFAFQIPAAAAYMSDPSYPFNLAHPALGPMGPNAWASEYPLDGLSHSTGQIGDPCSARSAKKKPQATFGNRGIHMSWLSYSKFLTMLMNKGTYFGERIIAEATIEAAMPPRFEGAQLMVNTQMPLTGSSRFPGGFDEVWSGMGLVRNVDPNRPAPYTDAGDGSAAGVHDYFFYQGFWGSRMHMDMTTGNYIITNTQQSDGISMRDGTLEDDVFLSEVVKNMTNLAPTASPTAAPVAAPAPRPRTPKVRGCGRAALASEAKCNKNKRCKWVFGSHACMSDCALANKKKSKCNNKKHCKYNKSTKKCKNKKHVCKYKTKKAHCRADETCGVKKRNDPKYDAKGNRVIKCRTRKD